MPRSTASPRRCSEKPTSWKLKAWVRRSLAAPSEFYPGSNDTRLYGGPNPCRATRPLQPNFCRRVTKPMLTVVLGQAQDFPYCSFSTSPEHSITGIQRSPTLLHPGERSFCSKAQASGVLLARCLTLSQAWQSTHLHFLDGLGLKTCDVLGFSLGGMVAQQMAQDRPSIFRRMILVGTAPRGGEDIMHVDKPSLAKYLGDPKLQGYEVLQKIFFAPTESSQTAGEAFLERLAQRREDREPASEPQVAQAQMAAFRDWETFTGERFANLKSISHPTLVVNGIFGDDSGPELLLAECEPAQRGPSDLSRLRPRLLVSISRVLHAASGRILSFKLKVRALLNSNCLFRVSKR